MDERWNCFCVCRRAAAEISQSRPCSHQGAVIIPVSLLRQRRASQRAGREKSKRLSAFIHRVFLLLTMSADFMLRVCMRRPTAASENCCWLMATPASLTHIMGSLCLWHPDNPQINTRSPSPDFYHSGILYHRRVSLRNQ